MRAIVGLAALFIVVSAVCAEDPYAGLSDREMSYVIPGSASWGPGNPCAESDCGGEISSAYLDTGPWFVVGDVRITGEATEDGNSTPVEIDVTRVIHGDLEETTLERALWSDDLTVLHEVQDLGLEVWAASPCDGMEVHVVCYLVAIDDTGRFAGLGYGDALLFTAPLAREAAAQDAASGRAFLEAAIAG